MADWGNYNNTEIEMTKRKKPSLSAKLRAIVMALIAMLTPAIIIIMLIGLTLGIVVSLLAVIILYKCILKW